MFLILFDLSRSIKQRNIKDYDFFISRSFSGYYILGEGSTEDAARYYGVGYGY